MFRLIFVALGAEQLVSNWRWQSEVRDSDRRINSADIAGIASAGLPSRRASAAA